jgi:catechol 2,3-dioxygenase-like lactoylglutathione lyase family enzyme
MARGPDHIVHAVRDLDAAADFYRRIGFTVGARNRHSWGTHNCIVQFPEFFIEILTLAEPEKLGNDYISPSPTKERFGSRASSRRRQCGSSAKEGDRTARL